MADNGWGFGWVVGAAIVGGIVGYKLVPHMRRVEETEQLVDLAERVLALADEEPHKIEALEILHDIRKYRQAVLDKADDGTDHDGIITKTKNAIRLVTKKLSPFSKNGKDKKAEIEKELEAA